MSSLFAGLRRHSTGAVHSALSILRSEKDPKRILSICSSFALSPEKYPDRKAISIAVSTLSDAGAGDEIRALLSPFTSSVAGRRHSIVLFGEAGMYADAVRTFRAAGPKPSIETLNALMFACILSKNHAEVPRIFKDFVFAKNGEDDPKPNITTYNTLIRAYCESGSSSFFFSILDEIERRIQQINAKIYRYELKPNEVNWREIKPNLTTFSIAIAGFYREERFKDVRRVLRMMNKYGCKGGLSIWNVRIQSLCKLKKSEMAMELLDDMNKRGVKPNWVTYHHLILGYCGEGNLDGAKRLFVEMRRRGLVPEGSCYNSLVYYLCKGGEFEFALEVCKESMERSWVPRFSTMKDLANGLVSLSKITEARELVENVRERFPDNVEMWNEITEKMSTCSH